MGTTDLEVGILKGVCAFRSPQTIRIRLEGKLAPGVYAKDVILYVIGQIGVRGATDRVMEFVGPVIDAMTMDSRMTVSNMAIEAGGTSGICLPDRVTAEYLWPFIEGDYPSLDSAVEAFGKWHSDADAVYEKEYVFDVSDLEPQVTFDYKPDCVKAVGELAGNKVDQVYIGTCTNGRLEDLRVAAEILKGKQIADHVRGIVSPATPRIFKDALEEGIIDIFMAAGFCVTNPTCGACLGMSNGVLAEGEVCASTSNRNFVGRMGQGGMVHLMSPATAAATAIAGVITDPRSV